MLWVYLFEVCVWVADNFKPQFQKGFLESESVFPGEFTWSQNSSKPWPSQNGLEEGRAARTDGLYAYWRAVRRAAVTASCLYAWMTGCWKVRVRETEAECAQLVASTRATSVLKESILTDWSLKDRTSAEIFSAGDYHMITPQVIAGGWSRALRCLAVVEDVDGCCTPWQSCKGWWVSSLSFSIKTVGKLNIYVLIRYIHEERSKKSIYQGDISGE